MFMNYWITKYHFNNSSAIAEMGDRAGAKWAEKWGLLCSFPHGGAGFPSNTKSPGPRPTSVPNGILIHSTVWPPYANVTDRQDRQNNGPVA